MKEKQVLPNEAGGIGGPAKKYNIIIIQKKFRWAILLRFFVKLWFNTADNSP